MFMKDEIMAIALLFSVMMRDIPIF
jgi:hypothetical protein